MKYEEIIGDTEHDAETWLLLEIGRATHRKFSSTFITLMFLPSTIKRRSAISREESTKGVSRCYWRFVWRMKAL